MVGHGVANATPEKLFLQCILLLFLCNKGISPDLCDTLESSFFLGTCCPFEFDSVECEIGSKLLYHVTPLIQFCHP